MKAILELDAPEFCSICPLESEPDNDGNKYCLVKDGSYVWDATNPYTKERAPFCPLLTVDDWARVSSLVESEKEARAYHGGLRNT